MKLIKSSLFLLALIFLISIGLNGCYIEFAAVSDDQTSTDDTYIDQPAPDPYPLPIYPPGTNPPENPPPHPDLPPPGHISPRPGINPPPQQPTQPHRDTGIRRPNDSGQDNSRQTSPNPPRNSWSPAPASPPSAPPANSIHQLTQAVQHAEAGRRDDFIESKTIGKIFKRYFYLCSFRKMTLIWRKYNYAKS